MNYREMFLEDYFDDDLDFYTEEESLEADYADSILESIFLEGKAQAKNSLNDNIAKQQKNLVNVNAAINAIEKKPKTKLTTADESKLAELKETRGKIENSIKSSRAKIKQVNISLDQGRQKTSAEKKAAETRRGISYDQMKSSPEFQKFLKDNNISSKTHSGNEMNAIYSNWLKSSEGQKVKNNRLNDFNKKRAKESTENYIRGVIDNVSKDQEAAKNAARKDAMKKFFNKKNAATAGAGAVGVAGAGVAGASAVKLAKLKKAYKSGQISKKEYDERKKGLIGGIVGGSAATVLGGAGAVASRKFIKEAYEEEYYNTLAMLESYYDDDCDYYDEDFDIYDEDFDHMALPYYDEF